MERNTHCVKCGEPNVDDCLTEDGLCFPCDVEETCDRLEVEDVGPYLDALSEACAFTPIRLAFTPSSGSMGAN